MEKEPEQPRQQQLQQPNFALYLVSILSISFWIIIWVMHLCALTNAKMKFSKKSYLFAANKRKTKHLQLQQQQYLFHAGQHQLQNNQTPITKAPTNAVKKQQQTIPTGLQLPNQQMNLSNNNNKHGKQLLLIDNLNFDDQKRRLNDHHQHDHPHPVKGGSDDLTTGDSTYLCCDRHDVIASPCMRGDLGATTQQTKQTSRHCVDYNNSPMPHNFNINNKPPKSNLIDLNSIYTSYYFYINLPLPGVSIIKPLVGVDKNLFYNLETFFHLDYPTYEILFCVQDPQDAATLVVEQLFKKYPNADARLFVGGARVGVNPKINNMQPAYENMKYELVLISDSGIQMQPDTLIDMVSHMNDDVALVHQMPFVNCNGRDSFQSIVERVYFGTVHARAYLTADLLNINCPTGMSALMRKCLLDEVGGIKAFSQYLAEDFFFAKSFTERGWKICISSQPALQNSANSSETLSTLNSRIQRWIKLRFAMVPQWTLLEPFSECMLLGLLGATAISFIWAINPVAVFILHVLMWFLLDYKLLCTIQNGPLTCSKTEFLAAWLIRECTALLVFVKALADPKVTWRSREFKLKWGGYTEEVSPTSALGDVDEDEKKARSLDQLPILASKSTDFVQQQLQVQEQLL